jgi:hypothetical protein
MSETPNHGTSLVPDKVTEDNRLGRVFEIPREFPPGFLHGGGEPVSFTMVDWFDAWPHPVMNTGVGQEPEDWPKVADMLREVILHKNYIREGYRYLLITDFGGSLIVTPPAQTQNP